MTTSIPVELLTAAVELQHVLDAALERFAVEHAPLLRRACQVPEDLERLDMVVVCTFLGHTLEILRNAHGRSHAERVALAVLDRLDTAGARAGRPE